MRVRAKITRELADFIMSEYTLLKSKGVNLRKAIEIINSCLHEISVSKGSVVRYGKKPFDDVKKRREKYDREYIQRPHVKEHQREYQREYYQRPEVKAQKREYQREYRQRPEIRERMKKLVKSRNENIGMNIDVFTDLNVELTPKQVWEKVGGRYGEVCSSLNAYHKADILNKRKEGANTFYRLNPKSPFHVIADGFFEEKAKEMDKQFRRR